MRARTLLLDTDIERITGTGTIDLARERIDLRLEQHAKDFSVGSLSSPLEIEGTLAGRHVEIDRSSLLKKGGAAAALGLLVHPAAALLPLVELGENEKPGACREAIGELERIAAR
jgi:AsmA protein